MRCSADGRSGAGRLSEDTSLGSIGAIAVSPDSAVVAAAGSVGGIGLWRWPETAPCSAWPGAAATMNEPANADADDGKSGGGARAWRATG